MPGTNWSGLIGPGLQAFSGGMVSGQIGQANRLTALQSQRLYEQGQLERQRRDMLARMLMPSLFRDMGVQSEQAQQYINQLPSGRATDPSYAAGAPENLPGYTGAGSRAMQIGGLGLSGLGALGAAGMLGRTAPAAATAATTATFPANALQAMSPGPGTATGGLVGGISHGISHGLHGLSGALGGVGMAIPIIGGLIGGGILAAHKIGQGRQAANTVVQGIENPFGQQVLPEVLQLQRADPQAARQLFLQGYDQYLAQIQQSIQQGGNPARAAQQSLANQDLRRTAERIAQGLGIPIQWGQTVGRGY